MITKFIECKKFSIDNMQVQCKHKNCQISLPVGGIFKFFSAFANVSPYLLSLFGKNVCKSAKTFVYIICLDS